MNKTTKLVFAALATMALFAFSASAATHTFTYTLDHAQAGTTGSASGSGTASYNDATGEFSWYYSFSGLSGPANSAHFHGPAGPGVDAGIQVTVPSPDTSPNVGMESITPTQGADLINGLWYLNIHTTEIPDGEIRGQLINDNPPVDNSDAITSLKKKIKKLKKKSKVAKKKGLTKKAKKLKKKAKKLSKKVKALS